MNIFPRLTAPDAAHISKRSRQQRIKSPTVSSKTSSRIWRWQRIAAASLRFSSEADNNEALTPKAKFQSSFIHGGWGTLFDWNAIALHTRPRQCAPGDAALRWVSRFGRLRSAFLLPKHLRKSIGRRHPERFVSRHKASTTAQQRVNLPSRATDGEHARSVRPVQSAIACHPIRTIFASR
jgi:hypothetical protein